MLRKITATLAIIPLSVGLVACSSSGGNEGLPEVVRFGYVVERPYSYVDQNEVTGIDIDIVKTCLAEIEDPRTEYEFIQANFEGLIPGLQSNRFDVVAGGFLYNDQRQQQADATSPSYEFRLAAMIQAGNPLGITNSIESLIEIEGNIGAKQGTYDYEVLAEMPELQGRIVGYDSSQSMYTDLENGRIIAVIDNQALVMEYLRSNPNPNLDYIPSFEGVYDPAGSVLWFRKGLEDVVDEVSACIKEIKLDGRLSQILEKHGYPTDNVTDPDAVTPNR